MDDRSHSVGQLILSAAKLALAEMYHSEQRDEYKAADTGVKRLIQRRRESGESIDDLMDPAFVGAVRNALEAVTQQVL